MTVYISLLRGINVSGQKLIKMEALRKSYTHLGFNQVSSYLQSGNVLFKSKESSEKELAKKISGQIKEDFGFEVPVLVFSLEKFKKLIDTNPFLLEKPADISHLYLSFLFSKTLVIPATFAAKCQQNEAFSIGDGAIYFNFPNGYGKTKMDNTFIERSLKTLSTTRNWKTCKALLELGMLM